MRNIVFCLALFAFLAVVPTTTVFATSAQAYQDYLHQFDIYRQKYSDFTVSKTEYEKFKTLTSQTEALENTKAMLGQRDQLLRAYLFLLNEKLNEDTGLSLTQRQQYQTLIKNEVTFLDSHSLLIPSIGSLPDATNVSKQLESHYRVLQVSMRQIITGISLGQLAVISKQFDLTLSQAQILTATNRGVFNLQKQETIDRWLLQITNKKNLYQQKVDSINAASAQLKAAAPQELDKAFALQQKSVAEARQYLAEGTSFLGELLTALRFID